MRLPLALSGLVTLFRFPIGADTENKHEKEDHERKKCHQKDLCLSDCGEQGKQGDNGNDQQVDERANDIEKPLSAAGSSPVDVIKKLPFLGTILPVRPDPVAVVPVLGKGCGRTPGDMLERRGKVAQWTVVHIDELLFRIGMTQPSLREIESRRRVFGINHPGELIR